MFRGTKNKDRINMESKDMKNKKDLTDEVLKAFCCAGKSDRDIGLLYGMTGEGVAYRRKKLGIKPEDKVTVLKKAVEKLRSTPIADLERDYYGMSVLDFSKKYNVSKTVWLPIIRERGIVGKAEKQVSSYPDFTRDQKALIIGSLLGDGGIEEGGRYYESHSNKQKQYLLYKKEVLEPYSSHIYPCDNGTGMRFYTVFHNNFIVYRKAFYREGQSGKAIPVRFIESQWDDRILAYWFLDDGYYDDENRVLYINNFCSEAKQLEDFCTFLENKFGWGFKKGSNSLTFSKKYYYDFFKIVLKIATPDVLYKIPEDFLTEKDVLKIQIEKTPLHPKFYRVGSKETKEYMERELFNRYIDKPFPYAFISEDRKKYLVDSFSSRPMEVIEDGYLKHNTSGMVLCESFFPNIYEAKRKGHKSPIDLWGDHVYMKKLIKNRFKYADRISDATMRKGIKLTRAAVNNFKPSVARYVYSKYCVNGRALDYSAGYGSRMLGAMSLGFEYVCYDTCLETCKNLNEFGLFLKNNTRGNYRVHCCGSETLIEYVDYFGVAFSCPPYFDYEIYSEDPGQSIKLYSEYNEWLVSYWKKTIQNCYKALIDGGFFAVCLSPQQCLSMIQFTKEVCDDLNLILVDEIKVPFKQVFYEDKYEIIYVFSKGINSLKKPISFVLPDIVLDKKPIDSKENNIKQRRFLKKFDFDGIEDIFKKISSIQGISRDAYKKCGVNGIPTHVIERRFGSWNKFIQACGLEPRYEAQTPEQIVKDYFKVCSQEQKVLSFHVYGNLTEISRTTKMKRLFNKGKIFHHLKQELFESALDVKKQDVFLGAIRSLS